MFILGGWASETKENFFGKPCRDHLFLLEMEIEKERIYILGALHEVIIF